MRARVQRHVRIYEQVRSAHLERAQSMQPATILYGSTRYDFDSKLVRQLDVRQAGIWATVALMLRSETRILEVNEPLMLSGGARGLAAVVAAKIRALLSQKRVTVVTYAIENLNVLTIRPTTWRGGLRHRAEILLARRIASLVDRIAFGTEGAERLYTEVLGRDLVRAERTVIPALSAPCRCGVRDESSRDRVLFLGAFQPRKGIEQLMLAWPHVIERRPGTRLTIVGVGGLEDLVCAFANTVPGVSVIVNPPRDDIHAQLLWADSVVLLSQRTPSWREQVGLPILEGLAHGCSIVTTTETGIAGWLAQHGHAVLKPEASPTEVAEQLCRVLATGRPPESIMADLPAMDGRLNADGWLFRSVDDSTSQSRAH